MYANMPFVINNVIDGVFDGLTLHTEGNLHYVMVCNYEQVHCHIITYNSYIAIVRIKSVSKNNLV